MDFTVNINKRKGNSDNVKSTHYEKMMIERGTKNQAISLFSSQSSSSGNFLAFQGLTVLEILGILVTGSFSVKYWVKRHLVVGTGLFERNLMVS